MNDPTGSSQAALAGAVGGAAFVVLGIPLVGLVAALLGACFSSFAKAAVPREQVPMRMFGVLMDAFIGGWLAVALCSIPFTAKYIGTWDSAQVVLAGLCAYLMQAIRLKTSDYFERAFQAALNAVVGFFARGKS